MRRRLPGTLVACLLAVTGCSSGDASPGDSGPGDASPSPTGHAAFCRALEDWNDVLNEAGGIMEDFGQILSEGESADDWPTTEETHTLGATILSMVDEADDLLPVIQSHASDADVADALGELHVILTDLHAWLGESARDSGSTEAFAILIATDFDTRYDTMYDSIDALDTSAADQYIADTCPNLVDIVGDRPETA